MTKVVTRIQEITIEINNKLDIIQLESVAVGTLLKEALEVLKEEGKKQADFLEYCKQEFSIGKAQAYKLMKVAEVFAEDGRFKGVAMRVLYALATQANDEQMERAAEFAANGSLNTAIVNQLLNPEPPKQDDKQQEQQEQEEQQASKEADKAQKAIDEALDNVSQRETEDDIPFDTSVDGQMQRNDAEQESNEPNKESVNADLMAEVRELRAALQAANELIANMKEDKETARPVAPMLPQFKNACPYAVLGLGQVESKKITVVKKAFRELIKCGYGKGHEAFELLTKAKDQLIEDIEAAKKA